MKRKEGGDEWKFANVNWRRVLKEIVSYAPNRYGRGKNNYGEDHPLVKRLNITPYELMLIMSFLEEQGLIEYDKQEHNWINLTLKGFDVSLKNQERHLASRTNYVMIFLMAIVAFTTVVSVFNAGVNWVISLVATAFFLALGLIFWKRLGGLTKP